MNEKTKAIISISVFVLSVIAIVFLTINYYQLRNQQNMCFEKIISLLEEPVEYDIEIQD